MVPKDSHRALGPNLPSTDFNGTNGAQLPQTLSFKSHLPSTELSPAERREQEIIAIQRDIAARRRKKPLALWVRLAFFAMLPTALAGWYLSRGHADVFDRIRVLYPTDRQCRRVRHWGLLSGTQFATNQDSIGVQSFLQSKEAMLRLDQDVGFKSHFDQDWIDPIQRLSPDASNEEAYRTYIKNVRIGYDPTEGVIRMEVIASDPLVSAEFSSWLISHAEERVNDLSQPKRGNQMKDALESFEQAEQEWRDAQEALVQLQQQGAILGPDSVIFNLCAQIAGIETQIQERELELAALLDNARPNQARVAGAEADIRRMTELSDALERPDAGREQGRKFPDAFECADPDGAGGSGDAGL